MPRPGWRRLLKWATIATLVLVAIALLGAAGGGLWLRHHFRASLPILDGEVAIDGLGAPITIERDDFGVPTIRGRNRLDVARATGFLHAQDRFFQMDLLRRTAAGELAALVGPGVVSMDRRVRLHRFRALARRNVELADAGLRRVMEVYAQGVNAGLAALDASPPEYLAFQVEPEPWLPEDVMLVVLAMYLDLQGGTGWRESNAGLIHDLLPAELAEFLSAPGTEWDAPIVGDALPVPPIPPAEIFDLRRDEDAPGAQAASLRHQRDAELVRGSNNWAVAGELTADGGALLANDMHLGTRIPNTWYRASLVWSDEENPAMEHRVTGVTLPGAPPIIAGSNGQVAWGFTNSQGDWSDLVLLEIDPANPDSYRTPDGSASIERFEERIEIRGAEPEILDVRWTIWGPVLGEDHTGRLRALRWIAHDPTAVDLGLLRMERAQDVEQAIRVAAESRLPAQNCTIADRSGRIAWSLMGPIPRRFGHDGSLPQSWAAGDRGWDGLLEPAEYPTVVDPPAGRIWTANNRVVGGEMLRVLGDGGLALGARAQQIRDDLMALDGATVRDMLDVQLDDRALLLARWRDLLLETLTDEAVLGDPRRVALRDELRDGWTGRASIDSAAYRMVRGFRAFLRDDVLSPITARCKAADDGFDVWAVRQWEGPLWSIVTQRPIHLLDPSFSSWDERLLGTIDRLLLEFESEDGRPLADYTWGERNTTRIQHPLSMAIPQLSNWLDAPAEPLPGDSGMPRVQGPTFGASERFVVSPGREADGIFHMPGGQSGHFLSPYYMKGHDAWARGEATPFLPGKPAHRLTLTPSP